MNISLYQNLPDVLKLHIWEYNNCHMPSKNYQKVMCEFKSNFRPYQYHCRGNFISASCRNLYYGIADYRGRGFRIWNKGFGLTKINIYDKKYRKMMKLETESDETDETDESDDSNDNDDNDDNYDSEDEKNRYSYYCSEKCVERTIQLQKRKIQDDFKKYGACFNYKL